MNIWKKLIKSTKCYMNFMVAKKIIFGILAILLLPTISIAGQITVTSYSYDILLQFDSPFYGSVTQNHTYTGSGLGPLIEHSIIISDYIGGMGPYEVVYAGVSPFNIYFGANNFDFEYGYAKVTAEWNFTPNSNKINLNIDGNSIVSFGGSGGEVWLAYGLLDTTDNHLLVNGSRDFAPPYNSNPGWSEDWLDESFVFDVLQNKNYRLTLFAETSSQDSTRGGISANFNAPVPEAATMLLLGSGLIGLWGLRKKFRK